MCAYVCVVWEWEKEKALKEKMVPFFLDVSERGKNVFSISTIFRHFIFLFSPFSLLFSLSLFFMLSAFFAFYGRTNLDLLFFTPLLLRTIKQSPFLKVRLFFIAKTGGLDMSMSRWRSFFSLFCRLRRYLREKKRPFHCFLHHPKERNERGKNICRLAFFFLGVIILFPLYHCSCTVYYIWTEKARLYDWLQISHVFIQSMSISTGSVGDLFMFNIFEREWETLSLASSSSKREKQKRQKYLSSHLDYSFLASPFFFLHIAAACSKTSIVSLTSGSALLYTECPEVMDQFYLLFIFRKTDYTVDSG